MLAVSGTALLKTPALLSLLLGTEIFSAFAVILKKTQSANETASLLETITGRIKLGVIFKVLF